SSGDRSEAEGDPGIHAGTSKTAAAVKQDAAHPLAPASPPRPPGSRSEAEAIRDLLAEYHGARPGPRVDSCQPGSRESTTRPRLLNRPGSPCASLRSAGVTGE